MAASAVVGLKNLPQFLKTFGIAVVVVEAIANVVPPGICNIVKIFFSLQKKYFFQYEARLGGKPFK